nr:SBBP repeat-containing protein [Phormidium sp. FACHB-592]
MLSHSLVYESGMNALRSLLEGSTQQALLGNPLLKPARSVAARQLGCVHAAFSTAVPICQSGTAAIHTLYPATLVMEAAFSSTASLQPLSTASALSATALQATALSPRVVADSHTTLIHASSLVFLDPGVKDYQHLLTSVQPGTEVHVLNAAQDAIAQITQTLLGRTGLASLHIVSHGQAGGLALGTDWLNLDKLRSYSGELQSWGNALTADADLLLYGCEVGEGALGHAFVQQLAQLTGADVAASDDLTGSSALGGDWILEVNTGNIDAPLAFLPTIRQRYSGVLDNAIFASAQQYTGGALSSTSKTFVDGTGNVYTVGSFIGTVDFDPGAGAYTLTSASSYDVFVSKLDANGNFIWAKRIGGSGNSIAKGISVDGSGNVYTTGYFGGTADFDPGAGITNLTSAGSNDIFVSKLDANGNFIWAKCLGGSNNDYAIGISIDGSGNVYTTGYFSGTADFDPGTGTFNLTSAGGSSVFISKLDASGSFVWAKGIGGGNSHGQANSISVDSSGNVYTTGSFTGTADFDPGTGIFNLTSAGSGDIFISKLDASGNFVWAKRLGGSDSNDLANGISVDSSGNVYTTGSFTGTADFDPGTGTFNLNSTGASIFVSKLDVSGNFVWAKSIGGNSFNAAYGISVDSSGNVYTTGRFQGSADFDPGLGTFNLVSAGGNDIFVSKLDVSGNFVWAKRIGGSSFDVAYGISVDSSGNVYTTGYFQGSADFDPGLGTFNLATGGAQNIFLSKLDSAGSFIQAQQFNGGAVDSKSNFVDGTGNLYIVGSFSGTIDFDPGIRAVTLTSVGSDDVFISKLDASGNFVWAKRLGGSDIDAPTDISVDGSGNVYTTGRFLGTADFDPGSGITNLTSGGGNDIFISKLDANGNFVWAKRIGGSSNDYANGISVDGSGNVYTTGSFLDTVDFDPGTGTMNLNSTGSSDVFVSKLDANGNFVWAKRMGGSGYAGASGISVDATGNVYTTGYFENITDFDPGTGTFNLTSVDASDIFISKLDANGNFIWAKRMGGSNDDYATDISVDASDNVYTTGYFRNTTDFDPGLGTMNLTNAGGDDVFVSKLDANGNFVWAKRIGGSGYDQPNGISVDGSGNVYITGYFFGIVNFDTGISITSLASAGGADVFVSKLNANGNVVWAKRMGGSSDDRASSISVDSSGNVYTTGYFNSTADFDPGTGIFNLATGGPTNLFLSKLFQVPTVSLRTPIPTLTEGNSGTTAYTFTVNLSNTSTQTISVSYATADGTATAADNDYTAAAGTLIFNPGETSKTITVLVKGDSKVEPDETFLVQLLNPTYATIAPNATTGTGTIVNDDYAQLLWRDSVSGQNVVWQLNGSTLQSSYYIPTLADPNWQIVSTADFDRDGNADILWRHQTTGENAIWQMNRTGLQSGYYLATIADLNWRLLGTDDFNGDGTADLLWRNQATGQNAIWQMNGFATQTAALINTVADLNWQIVSTADFDNDGKADLLWRNQSTGENALWQMNGLTTKSAFYLNTVADTNWQVAGTADFDHDGIADIVWRNRVTGENAIWQMNSTGLQSGYFVTAAPDVNWQLVGVADLGGDRTPDFLWRNATTGQTGLWQLSGFSYVQAYQLPNAPSEWSVRPFTLV